MACSHYSIVILTQSGGMISRPAGCDLAAALSKASDRRQDFPDAKEVRVVSPTEGVIAYF
jgi:hypothetical protein